MSHFIVGSPARDNFFYGYDKFIRSIFVNPNWIWLCGQRRVGKSSIMLQFEKGLDASEWITFSYDIAKIAADEITGEKLFSEFYDYYEDILLDRFGIDIADLGSNPAKSFSKIIKILNAKGYSVAFLWDEVERLIDLEKNDPGFLETLRAHLHGIDRFKFVIASTQRLTELFGHAGRCSSFLATFHWMPITGLDEESSKQLLCCEKRGGWPHPLPRAIVHETITWCGGHPFILQHFGFQMEQQTEGRGDRVDVELFQSCINQICYNETLREVIIDDFIKLTPPQQKILSKACEGNGGSSYEKVSRDTGLTLAEIADAVGFLANYGYIYWGDPIKLKYKFYKEMIAGGISVIDPSKLNRIRRTVFLSYSHKNKKFFEKLSTQLEPLARDDEIDIWSDKEIAAGDKWKREIESGLEKARVAVLLVSPDFLASKFITAVEIPALLMKSKSSGCRILCLYIEPSVVEKVTFGDNFKLTMFQGLNSPDQPLSSLSSKLQKQVLAQSALKIFNQIKMDD